MDMSQFLHGNVIFAVKPQNYALYPFVKIEQKPAFFFISKPADLRMFFFDVFRYFSIFSHRYERREFCELSFRSFR